MIPDALEQIKDSPAMESILLSVKAQAKNAFLEGWNLAIIAAMQTNGTPVARTQLQPLMHKLRK